jgi:hypothetical protein
MFRRALAPEEGVLLMGARDMRLDAAIHMFFVLFDLSVFWIDSRMRVVDKVLAQSWHPAYFPARPARFVLELHPDRLDAYEIGDTLQIGRE